METREMLYFVALFVILLVILFRDRQKSQRIIEQDKTIVQLADDYVALRNKLLLKGLSEKDIKKLRDKHTPEKNGDFSSSFTEWKKIFS